MKREVIHIHNIRVGPSWMDPLVLFLKEDILPEEKSKADKIRRKTSRFWLSEDLKLYKRSFSGPYLLCVHPEATKLILEELHEGICGSHTGGKSLSHKVITQGYWWPSMQKEAHKYVKKCDQCQRFEPNITTVQPLAVCSMGLGYHRVISQSGREQEISARRH